MSDTDADVIRRVTHALLSDPRTAEAGVDVRSNGGVVTLFGAVPSREARQTVEAIARQQTGVVAVVNELAILTEKTGPPSGMVVPPR